MPSSQRSCKITFAYMRHHFIMIVWAETLIWSIKLRNVSLCSRKLHSFHCHLIFTGELPLQRTRRRITVAVCWADINIPWVSCCMVYGGSESTTALPVGTPLLCLVKWIFTVKHASLVACLLESYRDASLAGYPIHVAPAVHTVESLHLRSCPYEVRAAIKCCWKTWFEEIGWTSP